MANAKVVIKGQNNIGSAVNDAVSELNKIKASAQSVAKVTAAAFEIGSAVAIIKKVKNEFKDLAKDITDPTIRGTLDGINETAEKIRKNFGQTLFDAISPALERLYGWLLKIENWSTKISDASKVKNALNSGAYVSELANNFTVDALVSAKDALLKSQSQVQKQVMQSYWAQFGYDAPLKNVEDVLKAFPDNFGDLTDQLNDLHTQIKKTEVAIILARNKAAEEAAMVAAEVVQKTISGSNIGIGWKVLAGRGGRLTTGPVPPEENKFNSIVEQLESTISGIIAFAKDPVFSAIKEVVTSFVNTLKPAINIVIQPLFDGLHMIGQLIAESLFPILDAIYPIFNVIGNILSQSIVPVLQILSPVLELFASAFKMLQPIIVLVGKAFTILMAPVQYVADLFNWLGSWVGYLGNVISTAIYNITHPFSSKSYGSSPGGFKSDAFSGLSSRLAQWDAIGSATAGLTDGTSTSTAISSAKYQGANQITINIYQQAPVVGDGGMRNFAQMILNEFESLSYYGVTA